MGAVQPLLPPIPARRYRYPGRKQAEDRAPHRAPATGCGEPLPRGEPRGRPARWVLLASEGVMLATTRRRPAWSLLMSSLPGFMVSVLMTCGSVSLA